MPQHVIDLVMDERSMEMHLGSLSMFITCKKKGTKLHFKSPTAERRQVLCVGVGEDRTHASRPGGAGYARLSPTRLGRTLLHAFNSSCFPPIAKRLRLAYPQAALQELACMGSIPTNSDEQNLPSFCS
jgi:hypothetical protein